MSHKKAGGSTALGRDSAGKRLGVKKYAGEQVVAGNIIIRQKGSKFHAGKGVMTGTDYTLFAVEAGVVKFSEKKVKSFTGKSIDRKFVHVVPGVASKSTVVRNVKKARVAKSAKNKAVKTKARVAAKAKKATAKAKNTK